MSGLDSIKIICEVEKNFDVNSLYYRNLRVWPIIRGMLRTQLDCPCFGPTEKISADENYCGCIFPDRQQLADLACHKSVDYMFISRPEEYITSITSRYYNIWLDPYIEIVKDRYSFLKAELFGEAAKATLPRYIPTLFLRTSHTRFFYLSRKGDITNFDRLHKFIRSICDIDLDEKAIIKTANIIEQYRLYFLELLSEIQPKAVLLVCYYGGPAMGLIWACRELNITSVDIQHGHQANHMLYQRWSRIPADGYELLPDIFHVWSRPFKDGIEKYQPAGCSRHRAIVGNNAWICKLNEEEPAVDGMESVDENFLEYLKQKKKVILVTLGPIHGTPAHLLEAMRHSPGHWLWLMRCHPNYKHEMPPVVETLRSHGICNYEIRNSTAYPLFLLLKYSHHHLTDISSSCLESLVYGVPTTFYCSQAYDYFKEYIDRGFFNYVPSSADTLIRFLSLDYDKAVVKVLSKYFFEMDTRVGQKALEDILSYSTRRNFRSLSGNPRVGLCNRVGEEFFKKGDFEKALYTFWNATKAESRDTEAYNNLAAVYWHLGRVEDAAKCIEIALRTNPNDRRSLRNWRELLKAGVKVQGPPDVGNLPNTPGLQVEINT